MKRVSQRFAESHGFSPAAIQLPPTGKVDRLGKDKHS